MILRWIVAAGFSICVALGSWAGLQIYQFYQPSRYSDNLTDYFTIEKNTTLNQVCQSLYRKGIIKQPKLLSIWLRLIGMEKIQAGVYQIAGQEAIMWLMDDLNKGNVVQLPFVIIAGQTWSSVREHLLSMPWLDYDINNKSIERLSRTDQLDGLLLADTYYYTAGSKTSDLVSRANEHLNMVLNQLWQIRNNDLPYQSSYEMLIAASIIEKETAIPEERHLISQVIVNRLKRHMRLQMDPTVIFAMGTDYHGSLSKENLKIDSPYNTYQNYGLPPTPIAMVSQASIEAAAHPKPGSFLYFVATGDGHHFFSSNYQQHRQAVNRYIQRKT